jgi:hypothetical protein
MCEERRIVLDKMDILFGNEVYVMYHKCTLSKNFRSHIPGNLI